MKKTIIFSFLCFGYILNSKAQELSLEKSTTLFDDFRFEIRENINQTELINDGWLKDPSLHVYRCRNKKRVRLTYWYKPNENKNDSIPHAFINVTEGFDKCLKTDIPFKNF